MKMSQTTLLSQLYRNDTFPKFYPVTTTKNYFYVSITTDSWTEQMFYELPCIRIDFYTETNGVKVRYKTISSYIGTYNPIFPPTNVWEICHKFEDVPDKGYISITPIFDINALNIHNKLIQSKIENNIWFETTSVFNITIELITN